MPVLGLALRARGRRIPPTLPGMALVWWAYDGEYSYALAYYRDPGLLEYSAHVLGGRGWVAEPYYPVLAYAWAVDLALLYPDELAGLGAGLEYLVAHVAAVPVARPVARAYLAGEHYYVVGGPGRVAVNEYSVEYPAPLAVYRKYLGLLQGLRGAPVLRRYEDEIG